MYLKHSKFAKTAPLLYSGSWYSPQSSSLVSTSTVIVRRNRRHVARTSLPRMHTNHWFGRWGIWRRFGRFEIRIMQLPSERLQACRSQVLLFNASCRRGRKQSWYVFDTFQTWKENWEQIEALIVRSHSYIRDTAYGIRHTAYSVIICIQSRLGEFYSVGY
jgi:hypothetical protein